MNEPKLKNMLHINEIQEDRTGERNQVYCRKVNKILDITKAPCNKCDYYRGVGNGNYILCEWEDYPLFDDDTEKYENNPKASLMRVSELIDQGKLKK